ncbi:MAG: hypothetical protein ACJA0X_000476 [Cyclobacteriaceae bacterium]|jgi:hypothetical protein
MNFTAFSQKLANDIDGEYTEYDSRHSVFIVPLKDKRFQTVIARIVESEKYGKEVVKVTSKVCEVAAQQIDFVKALEASTELVHTRFIVEDGYLKTEASFFLDNLTDSLIKEMILEVTYTADEWEFIITGQDNF